MSEPADPQPLRTLSRAGGRRRARRRKTISTSMRATSRRSRSEDDLIGYVHSYEVGSTVDGPGLRFVAFLTGCLLRCQYCHNPDTWHKRNGKPFSVAQAMQQIGKYAQVLKISKGGITLSGGEPMVQRSSPARIFRRCKELGLHTCCDTSGRLGDRLTDEQLMDIDLNLLDIKSGDPEIYERMTRQPLQPTLDYARRLSALGRPMWVRFVLVPGLTDGYDNVERVADICAGLRASSAWRSCASTSSANPNGRSSASNTR